MLTVSCVCLRESAVSLERSCTGCTGVFCTVYALASCVRIMCVWVARERSVSLVPRERKLAAWDDG